MLPLRVQSGHKAGHLHAAKLMNLLYPHVARCLLSAVPELDKKHVFSVNRLYVLRWLTEEKADDYFVHKQFATRATNCADCGRLQAGSKLRYLQGCLCRAICDDCLLAQHGTRVEVGNRIINILSWQELLLHHASSLRSLRSMLSHQ